MTDVFLGIDLGTGSVKATAVSPDGATLAVARAGYPVDVPTPGAAQTNPELWWDATVGAVHAALSGFDASAVQSVGLSGQMHGAVLCDAAGRAIRPAMLWADGRSETELSRYRDLPKALLSRLRNPPAAGMTGPTLLWLLEHESTSVARARWALCAKDWIRLRLTGIAATEPSDGSGTLLWDTTTDSWDEDAATQLGIPTSLLAPPGRSLTVAGGLTAQAAAQLGLKEGTPVAHGLADCVAGCLGTGLRNLGDVQLTLGTGAQLLMPLRSPQSASGAVNVVRSFDDGTWLALAATLNAGLALDWVRTVLGVDWPTIYAAAAGPADAGTPIFLPQLVGERTPYLASDMRGGWVGLGLGTSRRDLIRAALEGVAFSVRDALGELVTDDRPIRLVGGGSLDRGWRQLVTNILGRSVAQIDAPDASARGAAMTGAISIGAISIDEACGRLAPSIGSVTTPEGAWDDTRFHRYRSLARLLRDASGSANADGNA